MAACVVLVLSAMAARGDELRGAAASHARAVRAERAALVALARELERARREGLAVDALRAELAGLAERLEEAGRELSPETQRTVRHVRAGRSAVQSRLEEAPARRMAVQREVEQVRLFLNEVEEEVRRSAWPARQVTAPLQGAEFMLQQGIAAASTDYELALMRLREAKGVAEGVRSKLAAGKAAGTEWGWAVIPAGALAVLGCLFLYRRRRATR